MRFAERFLVVFALISILMRLWGVKDGPPLELIALPALALFYAIAMPFLLGALGQAGRRWPRVAGSLICGIALAYCIISLLLYTLGWEVSRTDMLVNCCVILGGLCIAGAIGWRKRRYYAGAGLRAAILLAIILVVALLPLPAMNLSRGVF